MENAYLIATAWIGLALVASLVSIRLGISVALIEIGLGVVAGNAFGLGTTEWIDFLAAFGAVLLTFLAGAEIEPAAQRRHARKSLAIGLVSFGAPFLAAWAFAWYVVGWDLQAAQIAGISLSTTRSVTPGAGNSAASPGSGACLRSSAGEPRTCPPLRLWLDPELMLQLASE